MLFSSLEFLYIFLPLTLLVYYVVPPRARNPVLLLVSLIFYGWGEPVYVFLMVLTILVDDFAGVLIERYADRPRLKKGILIAAVAFNLGLLGFSSTQTLFWTICAGSRRCPACAPCSLRCPSASRFIPSRRCPT